MEVKTKDFRVRIAFDAYSVGNVIQPVGLWRSKLLALGYIEPVEKPAPASAVVAGPESSENPKRRGKPRKHDVA